MRKLAIGVLAACLGLSGCAGLPAAREMGDMALLRTMGVDRAEEGVTVTVSTGPRARGLQAEGEPSLLLSARSPSLSGACLAMQGQSDSYVFFGYVDQLLLGEELARQGIRPVLDYFARDVELGLGAQLWLVRGTSAREAVASGGEEGVERRLSTLQTDGKLGVAAITRTAGELYTDLMEQGATFAPALTTEGEDDTTLVERGYGVLKGDRLAGFLDGEAARGLELLAGQPAADILVEELTGSGQVSVRVTGCRTGGRLEFRGDEPWELALTCRVEGRLEEHQGPLDDRALEQLELAVERRERARLEAALEELQGLQADCVGLGVRAAAAHPGKWSAIEEEWPRWFGQIKVRVEVQVRIDT